MVDATLLLTQLNEETTKFENLPKVQPSFSVKSSLSFYIWEKKAIT